MKPMKSILFLLFVVLIFPYASSAATPTITNPAPGSTLSGDTVTFSWTANGKAVNTWWLTVGYSLGEDDIYKSGPLKKSTLEATVSELPTDGSQVYVRLRWRAGLNLKYTDFTYTALTRALVPQTGQTKSYAPGDDGDLHKGVSWPVPRFTDNGNGTVTDNLTGLIWLQNANCGGYGVWPDNAPDLPTALADVTELNTSGTMNALNCGDTSNNGSHQTDWRLPNIKELLSLIDYGFQQPALSNTAGTDRWVEGDPFIGVPSIPSYLSSTTTAECSDCWWSVSFDHGSSGYLEQGYVWPVRGGIGK